VFGKSSWFLFVRQTFRGVKKWHLPILVGNGDLNLYAGLDVDRGDLLDDLGGRVQVDDALVDSHLEKEECHTYLIQVADGNKKVKVIHHC